MLSYILRPYVRIRDNAIILISEFFYLVLSCMGFGLASSSTVSGYENALTYLILAMVAVMAILTVLSTGFDLVIKGF